MKLTGFINSVASVLCIVCLHFTTIVFSATQHPALLGRTAESDKKSTSLWVHSDLIFEFATCLLFTSKPVADFVLHGFLLCPNLGLSFSVTKYSSGWLRLGRA